MNDGNAAQETKVIELPIWDRAHRDLNNMRDSLMKAREEAQARGRQAEHDINEINNALNRIAPPQPQAMPAQTAGVSTAGAPPLW